MRNFLLAVAFFFGIEGAPIQLMAQRSIGKDYTSAVGIRLSPFYGTSIKHFFLSSWAVEGILHSSWGAVKITALFEKHMEAFDEPGLQFYLGGGAHVGSGGSRYYSRWNGDYKTSTRGLIGVDGIIGLEYTIQDKSIPVNVSLDWKPALEFGHESWFRGAELGLTARYIFHY